MALTPGSRLGVYEVRELIGAGGMGEVYRGHDIKLNLSVALKILLIRLLRIPTASDVSDAKRKCSRR
jgi:serine/threonine protein kinase